MWRNRKNAAFVARRLGFQSHSVTCQLCGLGHINPLTFLVFPKPLNRNNNSCFSLPTTDIVRRECGVVCRIATIRTRPTALFSTPLTSLPGSPLAPSTLRSPTAPSHTCHPFVSGEQYLGLSWSYHLFVFTDDSRRVVLRDPTGINKIWKQESLPNTIIF